MSVIERLYGSIGRPRTYRKVLSVPVLPKQPSARRDEGRWHVRLRSRPASRMASYRLVRIRAELETDCRVTLPEHGSLEAWTHRGVLLLNTSLTVDERGSNTHRDASWHAFTDAVIAAVASKPSSVVFLLWGKHAQAKTRLIEARGQVALPSPHPMARQRLGFRGSHPFSKANAALADPIDWRLDD